jgi:hypothetical protein
MDAAFDTTDRVAEVLFNCGPVKDEGISKAVFIR